MLNRRSTLTLQLLLLALLVARPERLSAQTSAASAANGGTAELDALKARIAAYPQDQQVYELFRFWLVRQPPSTQSLFDQPRSRKKGLQLYRRQLRQDGATAEEADGKIRIIDKDGERWEVEIWNRILTSNSPRVNRKPNAFLVAAVADRKPGRALDFGMGQGRNALWLAQNGWDTTGFDPAEKAVALARENAAKAGVALKTFIAKDHEFDMGTERWDLIVMSYVDIRPSARKVARALAPGGIVVAEYFHRDSPDTSGGFADNELMTLFPGLRVLRYEDAEGIADFGLDKVRLVHIVAEKRRPSK